jgi:hypothetical protein
MLQFGAQLLAKLPPKIIWFFRGLCLLGHGTGGLVNGFAPTLNDCPPSKFPAGLQTMPSGTLVHAKARCLWEGERSPASRGWAGDCG